MMCDVARCKRPTMLTYAAFAKEWKAKDVKVCEYHWKKHCDEGDTFDLRVHFKPKGKDNDKD